MNKEDKKYITGKFKASEGRMQKSIASQIQASEGRLETKIKHNGIMIEHLEDLILRLAENQDQTNQKLDELATRFDNSGIDKFPLIWNNLKNHEKRITKLEAKVA